MARIKNQHDEPTLTIIALKIDNEAAARCAVARAWNASDYPSRVATVKNPDIPRTWKFEPKQLGSKIVWSRHE